MSMKIVYIDCYITRQQKRGNTMCTALDKIRNKSAEEILNEYGLANRAPVDIKRLLQCIGISALGKDFSALEELKNKEKGSILGMLKSDGENAAIFYRKSDTYNRQRFTIAHELAHAMIHTDNEPHIEYRMSEIEIDNNPLEKRANIIAGELLIPLNLLAEVYLRLPVPSSIALAKEFDVSVNVMEARLNHLGVSHFNSKGEAITYG